MKKVIVGNLVNFTFDEGVAPYTMDCTKLTDEIKAQCPAFAMSHRLGDNAAITRKQKDGTVITVTEQMRRDAVAELGDFYMNGATAWDMRGGSRAPVQNPTILAIAAKRGCSYADAETWLANQFLGEITSL
jgi:hypothetical protein